MSFVTVSIQDHTDLAPELQPAARVTEIPLTQGFTIDQRMGSAFARAVRKLWRRYGILGTAAAIALASQMSGFSHNDPRLPLWMGAITSAVATSWKAEIGTATHNFTTGQNSVKTALYTSSATLGAATTAYSATNEISGTGYTAAGVVIANVTPVTSGTTAIFDWADAQWTSATFTANGCLVYNVTASNKAIFVIAFGSDQTVTAGTFTIVWPAADASNAIIRIA